MPWIRTSLFPLAARKWAPAASGVQRNITGSSAGTSTSSASLLQVGVPLEAASHGDSAAAGNLILTQAAEGLAIGGSTATGLLGEIARAEGESHGSSAVTGELVVGQVQGAEGSSAGIAHALGALSVRVKYRPTGEQVGTGGDDRPGGSPFGSGREDGKGRRIFNPISSGRVGSKSIREMRLIAAEFADGE